MAEKQERLRRDIDTLRVLRDELRVQLNLAGKEARDAFGTAEKSWRKLESRWRTIEKESKKELDDVREAANGLVQEIREAYQRIRELL